VPSKEVTRTWRDVSGKNEVNLQRTGSDFEEGVGTSYSDAARAWDISRDTLRARLHGRL